MKNFKKHLFFCVILILSSFNSYSQESSNFCITKKGEKIIFYGNYLSIGDRVVSYENEKKKIINLKSDDVKLVVNGPEVYMSLSTTKGVDKLQKILAFNDKNVLTTHEFLSTVYIWDRDFNLVKGGIEIMVFTKNQIKESKENFKPIAEYFKNYPKLLELLMKNIEDGKKIELNINYVNCGSAKDLFTNKVNNEVVETKEIDKDIPTDEYGIVGFGITQETNEKIMFYRRGPLPAPNSTNFVYYPKKESIVESYATPNKFKIIVSDNRLFLRLNISKSKSKLLEIIAFTEKYLLAGLWGNDDKVEKCYLYDREMNLIEGDIETANLVLVLNKYFQDCPKIIGFVKENTKLNRNITLGFTYYNCGTTKLLEDFDDFMLNSKYHINQH
jgi:hypothetical protein